MCIYFDKSHIFHKFASSLMLCAKVQIKNQLTVSLTKFIIMVTSIEPDVNPMGRYTVGETSEKLGIHRHTLRSYVRAGYIRPIFKRNPVYVNKPRIRFLGSEILRFWRAFV